MLIPLVYAYLFKSKLSSESVFLRLSNIGSRRILQIHNKLDTFGENIELNNSALSEVVNAMGRQLSRVVVSRQSGLTDSDKKMLVFKKIEEAKWLLILCQKLPWIKGVALTGSLAALDPKSERDDLDVMIVCAKDRLWLARPILVIFSRLCGRRRSWNKEEPNSWCFNMWLEETALAVDKKGRNYYLANEVSQARWLINKDGTGERFLAENVWAAAWLPRLYQVACLQASLVNQWGGNFASPPPISWILSISNFLLYRLQLRYMKPHHTTETVQYSRALFHTNAAVILQT